MNKNLKRSKSQILAWCFYDWANSSYFSVVTTFVFSAYFVNKVAPSKILGTYWWGNAIAIAALLVALVSPVVGSIADYGGYRKVWLFVLSYVGMIACASLWFAYPSENYISLTLLLIIISSFAFEAGMTFYNAMLPNLVTESYLGRVSGWGWSMGYIGGLLAMLISLFVFVKGHIPWLDKANYANVRACGPFVAAWFFVFSMPLFLFVKDKRYEVCNAKKAVKLGIKQLLNTLKSLLANKNLLFFYLSRAFYIDAMNTIFAFGGIYAATTFHMSLDNVILFGIVLNISAGIGAAFFAWIDDFFGSKLTIQISIAGLIICLSIALVTYDITIFWVISTLLGLFVGPVQAASRSLLVRIVDDKSITEKFGLFALSGKATAFLGPWMVGLTTLWFGSQRIGLSIILAFLALGFLTLTRVVERKP